MAKRKFFRTVIQIEILSEDEPVGAGLDLEGIAYEILHGHCSGKITAPVEEEVPAPKMAELLIKQGSDPEFFRLDERGNELED